MSTGICSCDSPTFGNMKRPNCVIEQQALAFPMFFPRFKADGTRNTIDLSSATLGADITALLNATDAQERLYPMPRVENVTYPRTDTVFEVAPSTRKVKIPGVGGVRTFLVELWSKDAVNAMLREVKKFGCSEVDMFYIDVTGTMWGIKDDVNDTIIRGYETSAESFDAFKEYATDTTTSKIMLSFDLDNAECEENSYAILPDELGYKATTLTGLTTGLTTLVDGVDGTITMDLFSGYGSAANRHDIIGLDTISPAVVISLFNVTQATAMTAATGLAPVVGFDGKYTFDYITAEAVLNDVVRVTITGATGYDIEINTFVHAF